MKVDCIIGIDPGANGGIAVYRVYGQKVDVLKMPKELSDLTDYLRYIKSICCPIIFLEKLNVRPDDVVQQTEDSLNLGKLYRIQKMLAQYEKLKILIELCGIPFVMVHPIKWQSELKIRIIKKGFHEEKADRKRRYKEIVCRLYPNIKPTLWNADAVLIMHFGRYMLQNKLNWVLENIPEKVQKELF